METIFVKREEALIEVRYGRIREILESKEFSRFHNDGTAYELTCLCDNRSEEDMLKNKKILIELFDKYIF